VFSIFSEDERIGRNCYGKVFTKDGKNLKSALNQNKLLLVKEEVFKKYLVSSDREKIQLWKSCVKAINKALLRELNVKTNKA